MPPQALDAAIIYAPVGALVPAALKAVRKGGRVVCAGIHMSDIPAFRTGFSGKSDKSLGRKPDAPGRDRFPEACRKDRHRHRETRYPLAHANEALADLRAGQFDGAAVLVP